MARNPTAVVVMAYASTWSVAFCAWARRRLKRSFYTISTNELMATESERPIISGCFLSRQTSLIRYKCDDKLSARTINVHQQTSLRDVLVIQFSKRQACRFFRENAFRRLRSTARFWRRSTTRSGTEWSSSPPASRSPCTCGATANGRRPPK